MNILAHSNRVTQATSFAMLTTGADIFSPQGVRQSTPTSAMIITTPPTFAGITGVVPNLDGSINVQWGAASSINLPLEFQVYVALGSVSAAVLFSGVPAVIAPSNALNIDLYQLSDQSTYFVNGQLYTFGVRCKDGVNNQNTNLTIMTATALSSGNLPVILQNTAVDLANDHLNFVDDHNNFINDYSALQYDIKGVSSINTLDEFTASFWITSDETIRTTGLGTASYEIYDRDGNLIVGMSESGIVADANGQFKTTPVTSLLSEKLAHYLVKVTIEVDSLTFSDYITITEAVPVYKADAVFAISSTDSKVIGTLWLNINEELQTSGLGTASYAVYDKAGSLVSGMSESGIVADVNGQFKITPVVNNMEEVEHYIAKVAITCDGVTHIANVPITLRETLYKTHGVFSITSSNQFIGTLWATIDDETETDGLGVANYQVFDASGNAVVGMSGSGITADINGRFIITPVASSLVDLTHYTVKIGIVVEGIERVSYRGITLGV